MPKGDDESIFKKASIKRDTKDILKEITENERLYEYEAVDIALRKAFPKYFQKEITA